FIFLLDKGEIGSANAQKLLALMVGTDADPSQIMETHDLGQKMDEKKLLEEIKRIISQNPDQAAQAKAGKTAVIMWFVGAVMKATEGKANPAAAKELVMKELGL
ncbi:Asp-tRNA(Asn)/Glu-tRNA(Gln) amidotransferase GatCAB subunit B, partial [Candidatus Uhrbacteria bacterium]|nr:Asp-tRNA(Asn)/Glu-tRNA(Gln) amidotransferase GatCAB subunit B [Candidatus Uhrbacteria bacterium]